MPLYKDWTWIGGFGPELMLCAASARVGPARSCLVGGVGRPAAARARPTCGGGPVDVVRRSASASRACSTWSVEPGAPWAVRTGAMWTRKRPARCTRHGARPAGRPARADRRVGRPASARAVVVVVGGRGRAGRRPAGDLEPRRRAPRRGRASPSAAVWVDGVPAHVAPQPFHGLAGRRRPALHARSPRARARENLLVIASDYEQPFGTFAGALPARRAAARRLGRHGAPPRALVTPAQLLEQHLGVHRADQLAQRLARRRARSPPRARARPPRAARPAPRPPSRPAGAARRGSAACRRR